MHAALRGEAKSAMPTATLLIGDLGGTNTRFYFYADSATQPFHKARYKTSQFASLGEALQDFLREAPPGSPPVAFCCLSVCGPVVDGVAVCFGPSMGVDGWRLDERQLSGAIGGIPVRMLNDFVAVGHALPHVPPECVVALHEGERRAEAPIACIGPGTGLGNVYAVRDPASRALVVCASEGGMSDFVARTEEEWALRQWVSAKLGTAHVDVEQVVSGTGLANIHAFLLHRASTSAEGGGPGSHDADLHARILAAAEPAALIVEHAAADPPEPICSRALAIFLDALGGEAANLALRFQAYGGVYLAGGVISKLVPLLLDGRVASAYLSKGHSVECYKGVPLYAVSTPGDDLCVAGALAFARSVRGGGGGGGGH